jgi:hypothetical protein
VSAVVTPGFGSDGDQYAAVCGEGHTPPWKSATGTAVAAMRAATHHNQVLHPDTLPTELDIEGND